MKVSFTLSDETVVTSNTVKVTVGISGQVGEDNRHAHEERARALTEAFLPNAEWAYSNFNYGVNGLTFSVSATCRIDNEQNQDLQARAQEVSSRQTTMVISHIDPSVPTRELTKGESKLRKRMLERAVEAAADLGDFVVGKIAFSQGFAGGAKSMANATYVTDHAGSAPLGHSERIALVADVTVKSGSKKATLTG